MKRHAAASAPRGCKDPAFVGIDDTARARRQPAATGIGSDAPAGCAMKPSRLVALYPAHWRERYGKEFSALLEELPVSPSVVLDVLVAAIGARLSYVRRRFTGEIRTHGTATVARLARVAMLTVLIVTPVATGAIGYYLGRSQISPVAEPASFPGWTNRELQQLIRQQQQVR